MLRTPRHRTEIPLWRGATDAEWGDWRWQFARRVTTLDQLRQVLDPTPDEAAALDRSGGLFRFALTPHYATLIGPDDPGCPLRRQAIPTTAEFDVAPHETADPLAEDAHSPVPGLVHRYPDRVLLLVTHECALYCRYCTRRRIVGDRAGPGSDSLEGAVDYVRRTPAIRDVLLSGGDPLGLSDRRLDAILSALRAVPHVEVIRIGTRTPVVAPQRITPELLAVLKRHHPLWLNTHFNHPFELAPRETRAAMEAIADAGVPTGNQTVLLKGINDDPAVMKALSHALLKVRCRPYYLYACDTAEGLSHFRTPVSRGVELIEALRGHTSGFAVPTFVVDAPGGGGKIPVGPEYVLGREPGLIRLRNHEGREFAYPDPA